MNEVKILQFIFLSIYWWKQ